METNENENTTVQNLRDTAKVVPRGKCIVIQDFLKKQERSQMYNLTLHLKELEKEQPRKPKPGEPGWLSRLKSLPSVQVMIPESWDRAPHWALCSAGSLPLLLSLPASLPACDLCLSNK